jgi:hypothetical protein
MPSAQSREFGRAFGRDSLWKAGGKQWGAKPGVLTHVFIFDDWALSVFCVGKNADGEREHVRRGRGENDCS